MYGAVCGLAKPRAERNDCRVLGKGADRRADQKIDVPDGGWNEELSEGIFVTEKKAWRSLSSYVWKA